MFENFQIRQAVEDDLPVILHFIRELAEYEGLADKVVATVESLQESLFQEQMAQVVIGEYEGEPVGFAVYFYNFSTLVGRPGIHIDDIYVKPAFRGKGIGKRLFAYIAKQAVEKRCGRLEWWCLNWNESAREFYRHLGARSLDELSVFRLQGEELEKLGRSWEDGYTKL